LLGFLNGETQYLYSQISLSQSADQNLPSSAERIQSSEMALEALGNVIKHNRGVDIQCIGHFKLLFSLLRLGRCPKIQEMALNVLLNVTGSIECIDDIAANHVLVNILHALYTLPEYRAVGLDLMHAVVGDTRLVKEALQFGNC
jgi:DnaJ family protein C protein 13